MWINHLCSPSTVCHSPRPLTQRHDSATARHFGFQKTYGNLRRFAYWPHISKDTRLYIAAFEKCQKNKCSQDRPAGLLQHLPVPHQRCEVVRMDFVGPLPPTVRTFNAITVFVDKLTKLAHFLSPAPLPPQLSTSPTTFFFDTFFFLSCTASPKCLSSQTATNDSLAGSGRSCTSYWM